MTLPDTQTTIVKPSSGYTGWSGVVFSPDGKKAYIPNSYVDGGGYTIGTSMLTVVNAQTDTLAGTIAGDTACFVAFSPTAKKAYVTTLANNVAIINTENDTLNGTVQDYWYLWENGQSAYSPFGVAFSPDGKKTYVAGWAADASLAMAVIDADHDKKVGTIKDFTSAYPYNVAFSPDGMKAYVVNARDSTVSVIDAINDRQTATVQNFTGSAPMFVAFSPDGKKAYVANCGAATVSVIDAGTDTEIGKIAIPVDAGLGGQLGSVSFSPDGKKAYVANSTPYASYVSLINAEIDTFVGTARRYTPSASAGVAFSPDGKKVYAVTGYFLTRNVGWGDDTLTVIDPAAAAVTNLGVSPTSGIVNGSNRVTITGMNLFDSTEVQFGGVPGTRLSVVSDTEIVVDTPPAKGANLGLVDVTVKNGGGDGLLPNGFKYVTSVAGKADL